MFVYHGSGIEYKGIVSTFWDKKKKKERDSSWTGPAVNN